MILVHKVRAVCMIYVATSDRQGSVVRCDILRVTACELRQQGCGLAI